MRRVPLAALAVLGALALVPATAGAHPLGNFTTNQLVTVSFAQREADLGVVLDLAEIPTYQLIERYDGDGDGAIAGAEGEPLIAELKREVAGGLSVEAGGRAVAVKPTGRPELSFPPGQAGLSLTRLELEFVVRLLRAPARSTSPTTPSPTAPAGGRSRRCRRRHRRHVERPRDRPHPGPDRLSEGCPAEPG